MQFTILALVALIGSIGVQQSEAWVPFNKHSVLDYDAINRYLIENVPVVDAETNMEQARLWLATKTGPRKGTFIKALEKFVSVRAIASPDKCNRAGYEILNAVDFGTRGGSREPVSIRRIDKVVMHYAMSHAKLCFELYPKLVEEKKKAVKEEHLRYVDQMTRVVHQNTLLFEKCSYFKQKYEEDVYVKLPIRRMLDKVAGADPDVKYMNPVRDELSGAFKINEAKVRELFNKYIYEPCKEFNDQVGTEYLDAISFDFNFQNDLGYELQCSDIFYDRLAMGICDRLVNNKKLRKSYLNSLL